MIKIKTLGETPYTIIYDAFTKAFVDYEIPKMSADELYQMINRRGFKPELSLGAFVNDELIAFTFNGIGMWNGKLTAYDTGTGTIKDFRGKGIAREIFKKTVPVLKEHGVDQYLLEVLQHNEKAVNLYKSIGFKVTREFDYFVFDKKDVVFKAIKELVKYKIRKMDIPEKNTAKVFWDFEPAWQNSLDAINRTPEAFEIYGAFMNNVLIGYAISEIKSGDITQIAVHKNYRRIGVGSALLKQLMEVIPGDSMKIINVETTADNTLKFIEDIGVPVLGKQFEMIIDF